jgi:hypothetical protein
MKFNKKSSCFYPFIFLRLILLCPLLLGILVNSALNAQSSIDVMTVLLPDESVVHSEFGTAVDLSGDWMIIGDCPQMDGPVGYVDMYHFDGSRWCWYDKINTVISDDDYGTAVAIDGNRAIVGAFGTRFIEYGYWVGAAYIYHFDGRKWQQQAMLTVDNPLEVNHQYFGKSVDIEGDWAVVGAPGDYEMSSPESKVFIYQYDGLSWTEMQVLTVHDTAASTNGDHFGNAVAIDGNTIVVGAPNHGETGHGAVFVYQFNGSSWQQQDSLTAGDGEEGDGFGTAVAIDGSTIVIGAHGDDDLGDRSGSAYIFTNNGGHWVEDTKITASDGTSWDFFGIHVAISDNYALISGDMINKVYLFQYDGFNWNEQILTTPDGFPGYNDFGSSLAIDGQTALIGAVDLEIFESAAVVCEFIARPGNVAASDGLNNRIKVSWKNRSAIRDGFKLFRDGEEIASVSATATAYTDNDALPGKLHRYSVSTSDVDWGDSPVTDASGWRNADGRMDGSVQTLFGAGVSDVEISIMPTAEGSQSALQFDGNNDFTITQHLSDFADTALTIAFWMKTSDNAHQGTPLSYTTAEDADAFAVTNYTNFSISLGNQSTGATGISANDGQWHHIAVSWRSGNGALMLYKDGQEVYQTTLAQGITLPAGGLLIFGQKDSISGGPFESSHAFQGILDEVSLWKRALSDQEINDYFRRTLQGNETGLASYWSFDDSSRSSETIAADFAAGGGRHAAIHGARWTTDIPDLAYRTHTDASGDYSLRNIYYGEVQEFQVTPYKERHGFDPASRMKTLDTNTPTLTNVGFTDTTSFTISGRIIQTFNSDTCFVEGVEMLLDGMFTGVKTDAEGQFFLTVEETGTYTIRPRYKNHTFMPAETMLIVDDNIFNLGFTDTKVNTLSGQVRAGCNIYIGRAELRIANKKNPAASIDTTITTNPGSGFYEIELPAREYLVEMTDFVPEDPSLVFAQDVINFFAIQDIDLSEENVVRDFIYRKPPTIELSGFYDFGCGAYNGIPILEQGASYNLNIEVSEHFGDETCPADTGFVLIYDGVGGDPNKPDTLKIEGGAVTYRMTAGEPNILAGGAHPFQKNFQVVANVGGLTTDEVFWVVINGNRPREQTFATISPDLPLMILRDPPGDASYSYLSKGTTTNTALRLFAALDYSTKLWGELKVGFEFETGFIFSTESEVWGKIRNSMEVGVSLQAQSEFGLEITTLETFRTSGNPYITGENGDVFVGAALNMIYALTDVIEFNPSTCTVDQSVEVIVGADGFATTFAYTEQHIRTVLIPQLAELRDIFLQTETDSAQKYINQIAVWKQTLALNQELKMASRYLENRSFSAGAQYEASREVNTSISGTLEFSMYIEETVAAEAGFDIAGSGISGGVETKWRMEIGASVFSGITHKRTTGFVLDDDDMGDFFSVNIRADEVYGTPVFETVSGRSSCPWETGTQPRDGVQLGIDRYVHDNIPPGKPGTFILSLGNTSQSGETREYHLRVIQTSNTDGAVIKVGGVAMGGALSYFIPAGEQITAALTVERGPLAYDYENLQLMFYAPCEYEFWQLGAPLTIADTVTFSAHFISPCSPVALLTPENNWVINASDNNSVQIVIGNYEIENDYLRSIKFQYRLRGEKWTTAFSYDKKDLPTDHLIFIWDISQLPDGQYELRAVSDCGQTGICYSAIAQGVIDRNALIVFGTPQPSDGILNIGESIAIAFSDIIDETSVDANKNVVLKTADNHTTIAKEVAVFQNSMVITPTEPLSAFSNRMLTATVSGIKDINGNLLRNPVSWSFRVSINPVFWIVSNANPTAYQGKPANFMQRLKNAGQEEGSFTINDYPDWLTPDPLTGTIPPAGEQEINFLIDTQLNVGLYHDTVYVQTSQGKEPFFVTLEMLRKPPSWEVNAGSFTYNMNMTVQVVIAGAVSHDSHDLIAVFVEDECRGIANIEYVSAFDHYVAFLTIYSNQVEGDKLTFRIWDASSGKSYAIISSTYTFSSNAAFGNAANPLLLEPDAHIQSIELNAGWTWISMNVQQPNISLAALLSHLTPANGDIIKGQTAFSQYMEDIGWQGNLQQLEIGKSYCINITDPQELQCTGKPVDITKTSIPIYTGWNWIGYLQQEIKDINETLSSLPSYGGDRIKSMTEFAQYLPATGTWEGSLKKMIPGAGYMLKSSAYGDLVYPAIRKTNSETMPLKMTCHLKPDWQVEVPAYEYNMSITGLLEFNEQAMTDTTLIIGAFIDDECRGVTRLHFLPQVDRYVVFLMVYNHAAAGDSIAFRVYEPASDKTREVNGQVVFTSDQILGNLTEPYVLTVLPVGDELVPYTFYLRQNYPNPFNPATVIEYGLPRYEKVKLILYDMLGRKVKTVIDATQKAGHYSVTIDNKELNLASGLYFYHIQAGSFMYTRKMLLIK